MIQSASGLLRGSGNSTASRRQRKIFCCMPLTANPRTFDSILALEEYNVFLNTIFVINRARTEMKVEVRSILLIKVIEVSLI